MLLLTLTLTILVVLLGVDNVRMRMESNEPIKKVPEIKRIKAADGDKVYPAPLPRSLRNQGINWDSDSWEPKTPQAPSNDQDAN
jgi:hypothetical protein